MRPVSDVYFRNGNENWLFLYITFPAFPNLDFLDELNDLEMDIPDASEIIGSLDADFGNPVLARLMESLDLGPDCIDTVKNAFKGMPDTVDLAAIKNACVSGM